MKCHYCGTEVPEGEIFCRFCGTRQPAPGQAALRSEDTKQTPAVAEAHVIPAPPVITPPAMEENTPRDEFSWDLDSPEEDVPAPVISAAPAPQTPTPRDPAVPTAQMDLNARPDRKAPLIQLPTDRGLAKMFFLGILTLGIYPLAVWCRLVTELNIAASRYDGERTMSLFGMFLLAPITLGIYPLVWYHGLCRRLGAELERRGIPCRFGPSDFWLWNVLGILILVGPFVFLHRLMKAMNMLNRDFNVNG